MRVLHRLNVDYLLSGLDSRAKQRVLKEARETAWRVQLSTDRITAEIVTQINRQFRAVEITEEKVCAFKEIKGM